MKKLLLGFVLLFFSANMAAQDDWFTYKQPNKTLIQKSLDTDWSIPKNAFDVTTLLPKGYVKDGTIDYTSIINRAIKENRIIVMPDFPILINVNGVLLRSNTKMFFRKNSKIIMKPNNSPAYNILKIENLTNVEIYNSNLMGDRKNHHGTKGEWGMGIGIFGSTNIKIVNAQIRDCWGDGIIIGSENKVSRHIYISNFYIDNVRRNGISIINAENVSIDNGYVSNSNGTMPQWGIDIEPNGGNDVINNVSIKNVTTENCRVGLGIVIQPLLKSKSIKNVNIVITNHKDVGSYYSFVIDGLRLTGSYSHLKNAKPLQGNIKIINPIWENPIKDAYIFTKREGTDYKILPKIDILNPKIKINNRQVNPLNYLQEDEKFRILENSSRINIK